MGSLLQTNVRSRRDPLFAPVGFVWFFALLLAGAWVADDAYISYRTMEQLQVGNGPVWNPHERVQVYTGVIWFWVGYLVRQVIDDYFLLMLSMSLACGAALLGLLRRWVMDDKAWLVLVLVLTSSRGFTGFSLSGMEFPLVYLVVVAFMLLWRSVVSSPTPRGLVRLLMLASVVPLVRHDTVLLVAPVCLHAMWVGRRVLPVRHWCLLVLATSLPLLSWTAFSLFYYGFPLSNTFYAKAAAGIPRLDLLGAGLGYYAAALLLDPVILPFTAGGLLLMARRGMAPFVIGVALHMLYVLWIGGDHMLTRFLAPGFLVACAGAAVVLRPDDFQPKSARLVLAGLLLALSALGVLLGFRAIPEWDFLEFDHYLSLPLLVTLVLLYLLVRPQIGRTVRAKAGSGLALAACFLLAWQVADPYSSVWAKEKRSLYPVNGVGMDLQIWRESASFAIWLANKAGLLAVDDHEREVFFDLAAMSGLPRLPVVGFPFGHFTLTGQAARMFDASSAASVGQHGFLAGTESIVVDRMALADPYLARTRYDDDVLALAIAHWHRGLPAEYVSGTIPKGPDLSAYDAGTLEGDIALATRSAPLLNSERLAAIFRLNTGRYGKIEPNGVIPDRAWEVYYFHGRSGFWLPNTVWEENVPVRVGAPKQ